MVFLSLEVQDYSHTCLHELGAWGVRVFKPESITIHSLGDYSFYKVLPT